VNIYMICTLWTPFQAERDWKNSFSLWVSDIQTFDFLLKPFFLGYSREKSKTGFSILENRDSLPFMYINLEWRAKFQNYRLYIRDSDWLNFIHFSGYKYKIRLVSIIGKWEDQAWISISTILKFSAQDFFPVTFCNETLTPKLLFPNLSLTTFPP